MTSQQDVQPFHHVNLILSKQSMKGSEVVALKAAIEERFAQHFGFFPFVWVTKEAGVLWLVPVEEVITSTLLRAQITANLNTIFTDERWAHSFVFYSFSSNKQTTRVSR